VDILRLFVFRGVVPGQAALGLYQQPSHQFRFPSRAGSSIIGSNKPARTKGFRYSLSVDGDRFARYIPELIRERRVADEDQSDDISAEERRQFYRSRLIVDVHFDGADSTGIASTKDMSPGGVYLATQSHIPEGATLTLRIPLGGEHVVVKGDVVYSIPGHGVGVRFHSLSAEARALMERELPQP
jgi:hypothetical protein